MLPSLLSWVPEERGESFCAAAMSGSGLQFVVDILSTLDSNRLVPLVINYRQTPIRFVVVTADGS